MHVTCLSILIFNNETGVGLTWLLLVDVYIYKVRFLPSFDSSEMMYLFAGLTDHFGSSVPDLIRKSE